MRPANPGSTERGPSVSFVSSYGALGGSEIYVERLLGNLDPSDVRSVLSLGHGPLLGRLEALGYDTDVVPTSGRAWSLIASAWKVRRSLLRARPQVVHANGLKAAIVTVLASIGTRLSVVWVRHDFSMEGWRARALARGCRRVVCVSRPLARTFRGSTLRRVHVVHTGMPEVNVEREEARRHVLSVMNRRSADPVISLVGRMVPGKGHLALIEIAPELLNRLPNTRILLVGDTPTDRFAGYAVQLRDRIEQLGLQDVVRFLGHRDDALRVIAGSDLVVVPSVSGHRGIETEGFPLLGLEALAVGTPVVAYAVGGFRELLADCGSLVSPGDRDALLEAIVYTATDRATWERLSRCGLERVRECFSMEQMIGGLQHVYRLAARP